MNKNSHYDVIRSNNDFTEASVIVFAFGDDGSYSRSAEGHWLIFAVELVKKTVYCYCPVNRHPEANQLLELIKTVFIAPLLSFLKEKPGKLTSSQAVGKFTPDKECAERSQAFNLCNIMYQLRLLLWLLGGRDHVATVS